jgi:hypothetical protein
MLRDETSFFGDENAVGTTNPVIKPAESFFHMFISPSFSLRPMAARQW